MMSDRDLWNRPIPPPKKKTGPVANGYAYPPGTGPKGETCRTCRHLHRKRMGNVYLKCSLVRHLWTGGVGTDIRARSPACKKWEKA